MTADAQNNIKKPLCLVQKVLEGLFRDDRKKVLPNKNGFWLQ